MARKPPRPVLVKLMYGPADGDAFEVDPRRMRQFRGRVLEAWIRGHYYASKVPWNGRAKAVALWDQGREGQCVTHIRAG